MSHMRSWILIKVKYLGCPYKSDIADKHIAESVNHTLETRDPLTLKVFPMFNLHCTYWSYRVAHLKETADSKALRSLAERLRVRSPVPASGVCAWVCVGWIWPPCKHPKKTWNYHGDHHETTMEKIMIKGFQPEGTWKRSNLHIVSDYIRTCPCI